VITPSRPSVADLIAMPDVASLLRCLSQGGEEARIVGGAVRNALLGEALSDIDIATTTLPEETVARAAAIGWKAVPTGIAYGTVTIVIAGEPFEVTTLRSDISTDGRRAKVVFTRDFATDALRRDFTINALSIDAAGTVHDYSTGRADIAARKVRFIGEAEACIAEDYLRILRFYRFSARYVLGPLDEAGRAACRARYQGMAILSAQRIGMEMLKLLDPLCKRSIPALAAMQDDGVLGTVLAGESDVPLLERLAATERAYDIPREALRWLMALALGKVEDGTRIGERFALSNADTERLCAPFRIRSIRESQRAIDPAFYEYGSTTVIDHALLQLARGSWSGTSRRLWMEAAARRSESWKRPVFPVKAADLIERGIAAGPALGEALRRAERLWLDQDMPRDAAAAARIADQAVAG
jgi:poly(A) polymerase